MSDFVSSFNGGYHCGLNTEYHDEDFVKMFNEWLDNKKRDGNPVIYPSFQEFVLGFRSGKKDYDIQA